MSTITLSIPEDLKREMEEFKEMNWSEVARAAIRERVAQLAILKALTAKSKLTEKEADLLALKLGIKIRKGIPERHVKKYGA